ncbi:MAG: LysR family transcriptional regulator [Polyangiales bacterium]|nr:LysR family transcriptional regulator [Myxococcales bacterium]
MNWLNYHHLYYFWTVAREGSLASASATLSLSQPTLSVQIKALEQALGEKLFDRSGRRLVLTDIGRLVHRYAEDIFALGREMTETVRSAHTGRPARLRVGVANSIPKLVTHFLLRPVLDGTFADVQVACFEDKPTQLILDLAAHHLDLVLCDAPIPSEMSVRGYNQLLGESSVSLFGEPSIAARYRRRFPGSLAGAPVLLPTPNSATRREIDHWFERNEIVPRVVAEIDDSALQKLLAQEGHGLIAAPSILESELERVYGLVPVHALDPVVERYFAITVARKFHHPALEAICAEATDKFERHAELAKAPPSKAVQSQLQKKRPRG